MSLETSIIKINNVWKKYSKSRTSHFSLREDMMNFFSGRTRSPQLTANEFWALEDVNLDINRGEIIAFVGPNGSGKSTLLKLIANITYPDQGTIAVRGRVAPLIELGAGFNPDLNGDENIFVNGAMMGMTIKEIKQKKQSIINFSEIGEFIDMPVKNYSSGMYVRLAFSIAIHSEADIYLFDEVLTVGDAGFQEKCKEKIMELKKQQRTIIFVTHHQQLVEDLAQRVITINKGRLV